eukprot:7109085-Prymnesium_polylepis.1
MALSHKNRCTRCGCVRRSSRRMPSDEERPDPHGAHDFRLRVSGRARSLRARRRRCAFSTSATAAQDTGTHVPHQGGCSRSAVAGAARVVVNSPLSTDHSVARLGGTSLPADTTTHAPTPATAQRIRASVLSRTAVHTQRNKGTRPHPRD